MSHQYPEFNHSGYLDRKKRKKCHSLTQFTIGAYIDVIFTDMVLNDSGENALALASELVGLDLVAASEQKLELIDSYTTT